MPSLTELKQTISRLKTAPMMHKPAIAEQLADQSYTLIESQQARITVLERMVQTLIQKGEANVKA